MLRSAIISVLAIASIGAAQDQSFVLHLDYVTTTPPTDLQAQKKFDQVAAQRDQATDVDEIARLTKRLDLMQRSLDRSRGTVLVGHHQLEREEGQYRRPRYAIWIIWPDNRPVMRKAEHLSAGEHVRLTGPSVGMATTRSEVTEFFECSDFEVIEKPNGYLDRTAKAPYPEPPVSEADRLLARTNYPVDLVLSKANLAAYTYLIEYKGTSQLDDDATCYVELQLVMESGRPLPAIPLKSTRGIPEVIVIDLASRLRLTTDATRLDVVKVE